MSVALYKTTNDGFLAGSVDIQLEEERAYAACTALLLDENHKALGEEGALVQHHANIEQDVIGVLGDIFLVF